MADVFRPPGVAVSSGYRLLWPLALVAAGYALTLVVFYPGIMNYDARYTYLDGAKGFYGDWQSPVMVWLWATVDLIAPGSASMFLLIASLYWLGVGAVAAGLARRSPVLAIVWPLLALSPPLFAFVGVIWRDVLMAGAWLLAAGAIFTTVGLRSHWRLVARGLALILIVFGVLIRPNALGAAPLLIAYAIWPAQFAWKRVALLFLPAAVALFVIVQIVYYGAFGATRQHPLHSIVVFDLGGITYFTGENRFPANWSAAEMEALRGRCYDPTYWNIYWNGDCKFVMARLENELKVFGTPALSRAWLDAIVHHPVAYLRHRLTFFGNFLLGQHLAMWIMDIENPPHAVFPDRPAFNALRAVHDALQPTPLFRIGAWLGASLLICILAIRRRHSPEGAFAIAVCGSAGLYVLSYLLLGVASEFRYGYWAVLASAAGLMAILLPKQPETAPGRS